MYSVGFFYCVVLYHPLICNILLHYTVLNCILYSTVYWPAPPDDPQGIRVASVIELSVCLFVCLFVCLSVCLFVLCKFSNFFLHYKAAAVHAVISISYVSK